MKKKWKIFLSVFVILLLAAGGTVYYFFEIKEYDVADAEVEEIIESEYDIVLPDEETAKTDTNGTSSTNKTNNEDGVESANGDESSGINSTNGTSNETNENGSTSSNNQTASEQPITVAAIKDKYRPSFEDLQSQANSKIDTLVSSAYNEYKTKKQNGESISYSYFYQKYTGAGSDLEARTDAAFQVIYEALQAELQNNGFSKSHAKPFLEEYEEAKSTRETALLNKAKQAL